MKRLLIPDRPEEVPELTPNEVPIVPDYDPLLPNMPEPEPTNTPEPELDSD